MKKKKFSNKYLKKTKKENRFAVVGNPVLHSKSPLIFNEIFTELGVDTHHSYSRIAVSSAKEAIFLFNELMLTGMNVTTPFKKTILDQLELHDNIETAVQRIGGGNIVVREKNRLTVYNSDYIGVIESLKIREIEIAGKTVVILGAGNSGRAAAYALKNENVNLIIIDKTFIQAENSAKELGGKAVKIEALRKILSHSDIVISTIPSGTELIPEACLRKEQVVFDANYKNSSLIERAQRRGCIVVKGEEWLLNQAIPAYKYFVGSPLKKSIIKKIRNVLSRPIFQIDRNIVLIGFMGSGKTTIGKLLGEKMNIVFKDLDKLIQTQEGRTIKEIFELKGEAYFRKIEKTILKKELVDNKDFVLSCGGGIVLDDENKQIIKKKALTIWIYTSIDRTLERLSSKDRPLLSCPTPQKRARVLLEQRLNHYFRTADLIVSNEKNINTTVDKILDEINKYYNI